MTSTTAPAIDVTIGGHTRIYQAFITTAPARCDGPSTVTLHVSTFADVVGFAADPIPFDRALGQMPARLVLIGRTELVWQRARYLEGSHLLAPTDPILVSQHTLRQWLWHRLAASSASEGH